MREKILFYSQNQIEGISEALEKHNWESGIVSQEDLKQKANLQYSIFNENPLDLSIDALKNNDVEYYIKNLDKKDYYRIAFSYPDKVMFLDIETTGLSKVYSYITMIGWYKNCEYKCWLHGNPVDKLIKDLNDVNIVVTFNGTLFDLPFIEGKYEVLHQVLKRKAHIDLRFFAKRHNYTGGQKKIEDELEFVRPDDLEGVDGKEAISLWYRFLKGDKPALDKLIHYNYNDIRGMIYLFNYIFFNKIYGKTFPAVGNPKEFLIRHYKENVYTEREANKAKKTVSKEVTFFKHKYLKESFKYKIAGIDLTGSEKKASGLAILKGNKVNTALIKSDDDIIKNLLDSKVELVSIDSPLSLPNGRTSVFDDDPKREEIGIMRACERILKRRGVNVYPALIPSMQRLTKRGIELAQKIRRIGIPVIESFPGAAQDVLQIPRKKTDLFFLKQGLIDFGLKGRWEVEQISHDELDAITSALVGQFFACDYYEEIGDTSENYLILPSVNKKSERKKIIGLCGLISAGKTETARYIEKQGYYYVRYSQIIAEYLAENKIGINRENLQRHGEMIFRDYGQYWLNKRLLKKIENKKHIVVDGIRHLEDITFLKELSFNNFKLVYIDTEFDSRKSRFLDSNEGNYDIISAHGSESEIEDLKCFADYIISNNKTKNDLYSEIDKCNLWLEEI